MPVHKLRYRMVSANFAICRLAPDAAIPEWAVQADFCSITRTAEELSVVCAADQVPPGVRCDSGWLCLQLQGPFAFSEVGILTSFLQPLSSNGLPIFAVSTFDTDYVLVREEFAGMAMKFLQEAGHELV